MRRAEPYPKELGRASPLFQVQYALTFAPLFAQRSTSQNGKQAHFFAKPKQLQRTTRMGTGVCSITTAADSGQPTLFCGGLYWYSVPVCSLSGLIINSTSTQALHRASYFTGSHATTRNSLLRVGAISVMLSRLVSRCDSCRARVGPPPQPACSHGLRRCPFAPNAARR